MLVYRFTHAAQIVHICFHAEPIGIVGSIRIPAAFAHFGYAVLAVAGENPHYIEKYSVAVISFEHLFYLRQQIIEIRRIHAHTMISGHGEIFHPFRAFIRIAVEPVGMKASHLFIKPCGNINRCFYSYFVRRLYLCTEQVEIKMRMHGICLRRMVSPSVVAL